MLMTRNATVSMREHKEMLQNTVIATIYCESKEQEVHSKLEVLTDGQRKLIKCTIMSYENAKTEQQRPPRL